MAELSVDQLLSLQKNSDKTLKSLRESEPELGKWADQVALEKARTGLVQRLARSSDAVRKAAAGLDLSALGPQPSGGAVRDTLVRTLEREGAGEEVIAEAKGALGDAALSAPADIVPEDVPLAVNPAFAKPLATARLVALGQGLELGPEALDTLAAEGLTGHALDDAKLSELVAAGRLKPEAARRLGARLTLDRLLDGQDKLAEAALALQGRTESAADLRQLARLDAGAWGKLIRRAEVQLPEGLEPDDYARVVAARFARAFPAAALTARAAAPPPQSLGEDLANLKPLLEVQPDLLSAPGAVPDLGAVPEAERERVARAYRSVSGVANRYAGLGLGTVFGDAALAPEQKLQTAGQRIETFNRFLEQNPDTDWLALDYAPDSADVKAIEFGDLPPQEQGAALNTVKAYQRAYRIAGEVSGAEAMLNAGYASAASVLAAGKDRFVKDLGVATTEGVRLYESAGLAMSGVTAALGSIVDILHGDLGSLAVGNAGPQLADFFQQMDGFADLFGSQDFCECEHCQSLLGPAAYFVDLMCFVEEKILDLAFDSATSGHVLHLKTRRPDLWTLELTCENTNTEIPQLVIVNEILQTYIAGRRGFAGDLADLGAVEAFVFKEQIAGAVNSFTQPYLLPLEIAEIYLSHFEVTRADIAAALGAPADLRTRAALSLSPRQAELVFAENTGVPFLEQVYGIDFQPSGDGFAPVEVKTLLGAMRLEREAFSAVAAARFVTRDGAEPISIVSQKRSEDSVQNDIEQVTNLTAGRLDRMHRFVRLWRRLSVDPVFRRGVRQSGLTGAGNAPWTVGETDLVLTHLAAAGLTAGLDAGAAASLARLLSLQPRLGVGVEDLAALFDAIPEVPVATGGTPLFDRLFNAAEFTLLDGTYPKDARAYLHPAHRLEPAAGQEVDTHRLCAGLRVSSEDLALFIEGLAGPLGLDFSTADEADRAFSLTRDNLAVLYRHVRTAGALRLSARELFLAISLTPEIAGDHLAGLDDLAALVAFVDWRADSGLSLDELAVATGGEGLAGTPPDGAAMAAAAIAYIASEGALVFAPTVFATLAGVDAAASQRIFEANAGLFVELEPDVAYRLVSAYTEATPLTIPPGVPATEAGLREVLAPRTAAAALPQALGSAMGLEPERAATLFALGGAGLSAPAFAGIVWEEDPADPLAAALERAARLAIVFDDAAFSTAALQLVRANPGFFGVAAWPGSGVPAVRRLLALRDILSQADGGQDALAAAGAVLAAYAPAEGFADADAGQLAQLLGYEQAAIETLVPRVGRGTTPVDGLVAMARAAHLADELGLDGAGMAQLAAEDYDALSGGGEAAFAAFRAKYPDEAEWETVHEPFANAVLNRRRDALVDFCVYTLKPEFASAAELYDYFLIDPLVDACFKTSRVVAATNSVQLYVHRVLMNLERSRDGTVHVGPDLVDRDEWAWRGHYRLWEANRKIFLWPENWILPDLRDNKTPLFEELESDLLQREITEQSVLDAYGNYMQGFEEVANLRIAGVYHDIDAESQRDILYLFGVAAGDPPTYYFRTVENAYHGGLEESELGAVWSAWRKIDVRIPAEKVAPVVYHGRLYVFWVQSTSLAQNLVDEGKSRFVGYVHRWNLSFTTLRLDGRWEAPQAISLYGVRPFYESDGSLDDPLAEPEEWEEFLEAFKDWFIHGLFSDRDRANDLDDALKKLLTPRYDTEMHTKAREGYQLRGFSWDQVYPEPLDSELRLYGVGHEMHVSVDLFSKTAKQLGGWLIGGSIERINTGLFSAPPVVLCAKAGKLYRAAMAYSWFPPYATAETVIDEARLNRIINWPGREWGSYGDALVEDLYGTEIATLGGTVDYACINGALGDAVLTVNGDQLLLRQSIRSGEYYVLERLGTTIAETVARALFTGGVEGLLDIETQRLVKEATTPITVVPAQVVDSVRSGEIDFTGPYGTYYREIFFHIPYLIANHLNSQGKFAEAQRWYHFVFDPTAAETIPDDPALSEAENALRQRDRNWRYIEFRNRTVPSLRTVLTDSGAIEAYRSDPFNPHAIARLRISAYQKAIVMAYIDNLLDWADALFTVFERETVNEAWMLYLTAAHILGERPQSVGECGEGAITPKNYARIGPQVKAGSEFLAEIETWVYSQPKYPRPPKFGGGFVLDVGLATGIKDFVAVDFSRTDPDKGALVAGLAAAANEAVVLGTASSKWAADAQLSMTAANARTTSGLFLQPETVAAVADRGGGVPAGVTSRAGATSGVGLAGTEAVAAAYGSTVIVDEGVPAQRMKFVEAQAFPAVGKGREGLLVDDAFTGVPGKAYAWQFDRHVGTVGRFTLPGRDLSPYLRDPAFGYRFGWSLVRQITPAFCIPHNQQLLDYWDRVEDRLYKLRNCLDITGARRDLSLFAPEIEPGMLVRAAAAGLSLDGVLGADAGGAPPYRFVVMIERAKAAAALAQSFGAALNAAIERRDGEELALLRNQHQRNVLSMTSKTRDWEVEVAEKTLESLEARREGLANRKAHYDGLIAGGLSAWERTQQISKHTANILRGGEAAMGFLAGGLHLIPQIGSPFAMKYGGIETGNAMHRVAVGMRSIADLADQVAASAGLEAGFQRRGEGWEHQSDTFADQLAELDRQIEAATLRVEIAHRARELHTLAIDQAQELEDFYADRFTQLGLYEWMSTQLQRVYRDAYNTAFALARLAERAYRFEHDDDTASFLDGGYWDGARAGLLAASQLSQALLGMERRHIETRERRQEVDIAFSLSQIDPAALIRLKQTGSCEFALEELHYDLFYRGQYHRKIRSVRITVPCVTGPYTNVSALLELLGSSIRTVPQDGDAHLVPAPSARTNEIATSTAQNDVGVFELNFNGAEYVPFEGAGAVSQWRLSLPQTLRQFDYDTINDVVVHVAYTARYDGVYRDTVERAAGTLEARLGAAPLSRAFSLRQQFSNVFHKLTHAPLGTAVELALTAHHLPIFVQGRPLTLTGARLAVLTTEGQSLGGFAIAVNGTTFASFEADPELGGARRAALGAGFAPAIEQTHSFRLDDAGDLAPEGGAVPGGPVLDTDKLQDLVLLVEFTA